MDRPIAPAASPIDALWPALLAAAILLALLLGWVGYTASDDAAYYQGAIRWLSEPPFPGSDHWTTRFPVILTLAAALAILGKGYAALGSAALVWYFALVAIMGLFTASIGGRNIFDEFPDVIDGVDPLTGGLGDGERYPRTGGPFGYNGAFYYVRMGVKF